MSGELTTAWIAREMARLGYEVHAGHDTIITGGAADSRSVVRRQLFAAFPGETHDGNDFVAAAFERGAAAAVCNRLPAGNWNDRTIVVVPDTTHAMGELAHSWRRACGAQVVGITGTAGKTTAKELTAAALAARFRTHRSPGNLNSREGLPLALLSLCQDDEVSVLEMGMDSAGEIAELCAIAEPAVGVILNIGLTHVSKLGSIEAIAQEKLSLARALPAGGTAVLNASDPRIAAAIPELRCRVIAFGEGARASLRRGLVSDLGLDGSSFDVCFNGQRANVRCRLPGTHMADAALAALGVCLALGMSIEEGAAAVSAAKPQGRMQVRRTAGGLTILDDRYNSSPASLAGALETLRGMAGRRLALLGKMAELGEHETAEHQQAGTLAAACCDVLFAFGDAGRVLTNAARAAGLGDARWFATKEAASAGLVESVRSGDFVLVKGSRSEALETAVAALEAAR